MARILIIEDCEEIQRCLAWIVKRMGHQVDIANDGDSGVVMVQSQAFDVIVSDLHLPGKLQGVDLIKKLRELRPNTPVVVASGYPSEAFEPCKALGVTDFLVKPFELSFLSEVLERALARSGG